jgi:hypothetical protein
MEGSLQRQNKMTQKDTMNRSANLLTRRSSGECSGAGQSRTSLMRARTEQQQQQQHSINRSATKLEEVIAIAANNMRYFLHHCFLCCLSMCSNSFCAAAAAAAAACRCCLRGLGNVARKSLGGVSPCTVPNISNIAELI